jgi:hypothetical protein
MRKVDGRDGRLAVRSFDLVSVHQQQRPKLVRGSPFARRDERKEDFGGELSGVSFVPCGADVSEDSGCAGLEGAELCGGVERSRVVGDVFPDGDVESFGTAVKGYRG